MECQITVSMTVDYGPVSVRLSVTSRCSTKTAKRRITQTDSVAGTAGRRRCSYS